MEPSNLTTLSFFEPDVAAALIRLVAGEATLEEHEVVARWSAQDPERARYVDALQAAWLDASFVPLPDEVERRWHDVRTRLRGVPTPTIPAHAIDSAPRRAIPASPRRPAAPVGRRWVMAGLAAAACAVVLGVASQWRAVRPSSRANTESVYTTQRAQRASFDLPDGTQVILGPATTLRYRVGAGGARMLALDGQAYFTVVHASQAPFVVQAGGVATRVLGTAFAVRAYDDDRATQVAVAEGKVSVGGETVLLAGDVARATSNQQVSVVRDARIADVVGWTHGRLMFRDTVLRAVIPELARAYDLDIRIADSTLANRHVTLELTNEPVQNVLHIVATVAGATYEQQGRVVVFSRSR